MSLSLIEQIHIAVAQAPSSQLQHPVTVIISHQHQQNGVAVTPTTKYVMQ